MVSLAHRLFAICLIAMALPACSPPDKTDLLSISLSIPNVEFYPDEDESSVPLLKTATELAESFIDRGGQARHQWTDAHYRRYNHR